MGADVYKNLDDVKKAFPEGEKWIWQPQGEGVSPRYAEYLVWDRQQAGVLFVYTSEGEERRVRGYGRDEFPYVSSPPPKEVKDMWPPIRKIEQDGGYRYEWVKDDEPETPEDYCWVNLSGDTLEFIIQGLTLTVVSSQRSDQKFRITADQQAWDQEQIMKYWCAREGLTFSHWSYIKK